MQIIADLHTHSRYSRAVSPKMNLQEIAMWSAKKGINLVSTGDWQHPLWFKEISTQLEETQPGIYKLKDALEDDIRFLLSTEISSIYSQGGQTRRIHNLVFSPSLQTCEKVIKELMRRGANLLADGRPIVGISSKDLASLLFSIDENILLIPAHAWTPWFSLYGSNSGFDSIEECFGEMAPHIYGIETGLSSDPLMNWQIEDLKNRSILSFSDAHSAPKLGREATVFTTNSEQRTTNSNFSYGDIADAIKQKPNSKFKIGYTIEFFPQEGKYHWSGHRNCGTRFSPKEIAEKGMICPVCHRRLTIGVENRVIDLAHHMFDEKDTVQVKNVVETTFVYDQEKKRPPFVSLVPLLEILLETNNNSPTRALAEYEKLTSEFATEFDILMKKPLEEIGQQAGEKVQKAIQLVRSRNVFVDPGFDGVFGKVKIFQEDAKENIKEQKAEQASLF